MQTINSANELIDIGAWTFNHPDLLKLLQTKAQSGVKVNLYAHISLLNSEKLENLVVAGVTVYGHKRLHAKFVFADKTHGLVMTSNIAGHGLDDGFDSGVFFTAAESDTVSKIIEEISSSCTYRYLFKPQIGNLISGAEGYMFNKSLSKIVPIQCMDVHTSKRSIKSPIEMVKPVYVDNAILKLDAEIRVFKSEQLLIDFTPELLPPVNQLEKQESTDSKIQLYVRKDNKTMKYVCVQNWEDVEKTEEFVNNNYSLVIQTTSE